jgi:hypothetical protein
MAERSGHMAAVKVTEEALRQVGRALSLAARSGSDDVPEYVEAMRTVSERMFWICEAATEVPGMARAWGFIEEGLRTLWTAPNGETDPREASESL